MLSQRAAPLVSTGGQTLARIAVSGLVMSHEKPSQVRLGVRRVVRRGDPGARIRRPLVSIPTNDHGYAGILT